MDRDRKKKMIIRWSIFSAISIAAYLLARSLLMGELPPVKPFEYWPNRFIVFPASHWWDILIGPIWTSIFILLFSHASHIDDLYPVRDWFKRIFIRYIYNDVANQHMIFQFHFLAVMVSGFFGIRDGLMHGLIYLLGLFLGFWLLMIFGLMIFIVLPVFFKKSVQLLIKKIKDLIRRLSHWLMAK